VISLTENAKKRNQLLLAPILRQLRQKAPSKGARQSLLLPFGSVNMSHDYVSPLVVAKPAQRFGMLSTV
jgi:cell division inhibitor SulA